MANTPPIRRIYMQDVIDAEGNVDGERLLYPLNQFLEATYSLFDGDVRFADNILSQINVISFTTASDYVANNTFTAQTFLINMKKRPEGVMVMQTQLTNSINTAITEPVSVSWVETTDSVSINFVTGLADSTAYTIRLLVI